MLACGLYGDVPASVSKDRVCPDSVQWLCSNKLSWCQSCSANQLENREHHLAVCPNPRAKQIRKDWLTKLLKYTLAKLPLLHARLQRHFTLHPDGHLTWEQSTNKASQILSGCVPRAWWDELFEQATASFPTRPSDEERASVDHGNYYKFLDWLKRHLPTDIWAPLREVRTSLFFVLCSFLGRSLDQADACHMASVYLGFCSIWNTHFCLRPQREKNSNSSLGMKLLEGTRTKNNLQLIYYWSKTACYLFSK